MPQIKSTLASVCIGIVMVVSVCFGDTDQDSSNIPIPVFIPLHYDVEIDLASLVDWSGELKNNIVPVKLKVNGKLNGFKINPSSFSYEDFVRFCSLKVKNKTRPRIQFTGSTSEFLDNAQISHVEVQNGTHNFIIEREREARRHFSDVELEWNASNQIKLAWSIFYNIKVSEDSYTFKSKIYESENLLSPEIWTAANECGGSKYFVVKYSGSLHHSKKQFFPCGMDSNILSTYRLTVIRNSYQSVATNGKLLKSEYLSERLGCVRDTFQVTPPMKAASFSFFVTNFDSLSRTSADGTTVNFHAPQCILDEFDRGNFTVDAAVNILDIYSDYFNNHSANSTNVSSKHLPIGKIDVFLDMARLPLQEPGLIALSKPTIFETESDPLGYRGATRWRAPKWARRMPEQDVTIDLTRAIILQWFNPYDNLLQRKHSPASHEEETLKFLHVYLIEEALSSINSSFLWNGTLNRKIACESDYEVTGKDYTASDTHFCNKEIWKPEKFLVLRMLSDDSVLGREPIRKAIISFQEKIETKSQVGWSLINGKKYRELFIESLQEAAQGQPDLPENVTLKDVLNSWERQIARPKENKEDLKLRQLIIVNVDVVNDTHLSFTQERIKGPLADSDWNSAPWHLPVSVQTEEGLQAKFWLSNSSTPVIVPVNHTHAEWVLLDPNSTSIHRTHYHPILLQKIQKQLVLDHTVFSPATRFKLFSDYFRFMNPSSLYNVEDFNGTYLFENVTVSDVLEFTRYLDKEADILVWCKVLGIFANKLPNSLYYDIRPSYPGVHHLNEYMRPKYSSVLQSIDIPSITLHSSEKLQLEAWTMLNACADGSPVCKEKVKQLLNQWKADPEFLSFNTFINQVAHLLLTIIRGGGKEAFDFIIERYFAGDESSQKKNLYYPMAMLVSSQDKESLEVLLTNLTTEVITDDNPFALGRMRNPMTYFTAIPELTSQNFVSLELYQKFFYKHCGRIESTLSSFIDKRDQAYPGMIGVTLHFDNTELPDFFPEIFTRAQFDEMLDFVDSDPECLRSISKGTVAMKLLKLYSRVRKHEEWMSKTGKQIYSWFKNNINSRVP